MTFCGIKSAFGRQYAVSARVSDCWKRFVVAAPADSGTLPVAFPLRKEEERFDKYPLYAIAPFCVLEYAETSVFLLLIIAKNRLKSNMPDCQKVLLGLCAKPHSGNFLEKVP